MDLEAFKRTIIDTLDKHAPLKKLSNGQSL